MHQGMLVDQGAGTHPDRDRCVSGLDVTLPGGALSTAGALPSNHRFASYQR